MRGARRAPRVIYRVQERIEPAARRGDCHAARGDALARAGKRTNTPDPVHADRSRRISRRISRATVHADRSTRSMQTDLGEYLGEYLVLQSMQTNQHGPCARSDEAALCFTLYSPLLAYRATQPGAAASSRAPPSIHRRSPARRLSKRRALRAAVAIAAVVSVPCCVQSGSRNGGGQARECDASATHRRPGPDRPAWTLAQVPERASAVEKKAASTDALRAVYKELMAASSRSSLQVFISDASRPHELRYALEPDRKHD